jgi:hypothetical protein
LIYTAILSLKAGPSSREAISLQKVDSLLDLVDTREAKVVSANNQPSGFEACVLNGME